MPRNAFQFFIFSLMGALSFYASIAVAAPERIRVPAEWEAHKAIWMQWPGPYEQNVLKDLTEVLSLLTHYQKIHLIVGNHQEQKSAQEHLENHFVNLERITFHIRPIDNSRLRDNGPIYIFENGLPQILDFNFTGWGKKQSVPYDRDDQIPSFIAETISIPVINQSNYSLRRSNLEVNGQGVALLNWDCQHKANPNLSQEEHEQILSKALGLRKIIWSYGYDTADFTTSHIENTARFLDDRTVAIAQKHQHTDLTLAEKLRQEGFWVTWYSGNVNWLNGSTYLLASSSGDEVKDRELYTLLESFYPDKEIHLLPTPTLIQKNCGIHCITNDQPAAFEINNFSN